MLRSIFYQNASADPATDPWQRATGEPPFDITGLTNGTGYRFDDGQNIVLRTPQAPALSDADAQAYVTAVETADGQSLEPAIAAAIDAFVVGLKADGLWSALNATCIMAGARTLAGALVPLRGPAPTNVGFVAGDYSRTLGLLGDGVGKKLDANRDNNADPQNSHHLAVWLTSLPGTDTGVIGSGVTNPGSSGIIPDATQFRTRSRTASLHAHGTLAMGFAGISRATSDAYVARNGGVNYNQTQGSGSPLSAPTEVFSRGLSDTYWPGSIRFYSVGEAVNLESFDNRLTTLFGTIEAALT